MKKITRKSKKVVAPFESGQIWQLGEARLKIGLVGKRLVHYRHYKGAHASPIFLCAKDVLEKRFQEHRAVLLPKSAMFSPAPPGRPAAESNREPARRERAGTTDI